MAQRRYCVKAEIIRFLCYKKGNPFSSEIDLEWRISFSLQERELMFSLTDVQHKCYMILKMFNRDIIKLEYIASLHWNTCLFYTLDENSKHVWKRKHIFYCGDDLFDGRLYNKIYRIILEKKLKELLNVGFNSLSNIKSDNICLYVTM